MSKFARNDEVYVQVQALCRVEFKRSKLQYFERLPMMSAQKKVLVVALIAVFYCTMSIYMFAQKAAEKVAEPQAKTAAESQSTETDTLLKKANSLYYSYKREGVSGFDCTAKQDWSQLIPDTEDHRIQMLGKVTMTLHGRMDGNSTLDWVNPAEATDEEKSGLLNTMHSAVQQTLMGYMQFWTPFINGDVIPDSSQGLVVHKTPEGLKVHGEDSEATLDEKFDNNMLLTNYDVTTSGQLVRFEPHYVQQSKGWLVNSFNAHMGPIGAKPEQTQEMHVGIDYEEVDGAEIPRVIRFEVVGTAKFNVTLSGCTVLKKK